MHGPSSASLPCPPPISVYFVCVCVMAGSLICCHSCALKWSHLRANSAIRAFHTQSFTNVCARVCARARSYDEDCAYKRVSRFSEISPPKNLAIWSSTRIPKESGRTSGSQEASQGNSSLFFLCSQRQQVYRVFFCKGRERLYTATLDLMPRT